MTVLIVEKYEGNARAYAKALSRYDVHICTDPDAAPDLLSQLRPDALIIDLATLLNIGALPYCPRAVIALTYFVSDDVMERAATAGVNDMILLPCSTKYLADRLDQLLCATVD